MNNKCKICGKECSGKLVIGDFKLVNGSDFIVCKECMNHYANHEYDKLTEKLISNYE